MVNKIAKRYIGFANQKRNGTNAPPNGNNGPQKNMNELSAQASGLPGLSI